MKIEPIITNRIETKHTSFAVNLELKYNITFIYGDSGTGKSAVYSFIEETASENKQIRCLNYLDYKKSYKNTIKRSKGKLFVIDNADLLLDDSLREYIATDTQNQYIIIGRVPTGLLLSQDEIFELCSEKNEEGITTFSLAQAFK